MTENASDRIATDPAVTPQDVPPFTGAGYPGTGSTGADPLGTGSAGHPGTSYSEYPGPTYADPSYAGFDAGAGSGATAGGGRAAAWQTQLSEFRSSPAWQQTQATAGKVFRRSRSDKMISGVCGGLGRSLGIDPNWLRIGLVAATVLGFGAGVVIYAICWAVVPFEEDASIAVSQ